MNRNKTMNRNKIIEQATNCLYYLDAENSWLLSITYLRDFRQCLKSNGIDTYAQQDELVESFELLLDLTDDEISSIESTTDNIVYRFEVVTNKKSGARWLHKVAR